MLMKYVLVLCSSKGTSFSLLKFYLLHVLVFFVNMMENGLTEDVIEKIAGKKLSEIVELK